MSPATIVIDGDGLDRQVLGEIEATCGALGAELVSARAGLSQVPTLVIGALHPGQRRIPVHLVDLATRSQPGAPLLLLSGSPLVRPVVTSHGGRVTLLAQPATPGRVRGTVRMLMAGTGGLTREHLEPRVWTGILPAATPAAVRRSAAGVIAVVPVPGHDELLAVDGHAACAQIENLLRVPGSDEELNAALRAIVGGAVGVVALTSEAREWTVYWPPARAPLLLYSPVRLPNLTNLAEAAGGRMLRLRAAEGDCLAGLGCGQPGGDTALADGGPAFLDELERQGETTGCPGVLIEVR